LRAAARFPNPALSSRPWLRDRTWFGTQTRGRRSTARTRFASFDLSPPPRSPRALLAPEAAPPAAGERVEREQQHDRANDGEQERPEVPAEVHLVPDQDVADEAAEEGAHEPDGKGREAADLLPAGCDRSRDETREQTEEEPGDDPHGVGLTGACGRSRSRG